MRKAPPLEGGGAKVLPLMFSYVIQSIIIIRIATDYVSCHLGKFLICEKLLRITCKNR